MLTERFNERLSTIGLLHYSVGALIERESDEKYLLIDRAKWPYGVACVAGHVKEKESIINALNREVFEEVGLKVINSHLVFKEVLENNPCDKGANAHYWHVYRCIVEGNVKEDPREVKFAGWYSKDEIKRLGLEDSWERLFEKMGII